MHSLVETWQQWCALLHQDESAKFALVIFEQELASFEFYFRVAARDRDVVDSQIALVAAAQLEHSLVERGLDNVNDSGRVFLLTETFKNHIVALWSLILDQIVSLIFCLHHQRVGRLADLALKGLPEVR